MEKSRAMVVEVANSGQVDKLDKKSVGKSIVTSLERPPEKALDALKENRLLRLYCRSSGTVVSELYVFFGKNRCYIMLPRTFCSCKDFEIGVIMRRSKGSCYHLIALELAISQGRLRSEEVNCDLIEAVALEILLQDDSPTLRRLLYR